MPLDRRILVTALVTASFSLVLLTGQQASGAGKLLSPADDDQVASAQPTEAVQPVLKEIRPAGPPITLGISGGTLLHLPGEARTVYVADPDVADVQVQATQRQYVYINAKKPGTTAVYAVDNDGHILLSKDIDVAPRPV